jgi:hypothetical protein
MTQNIQHIRLINGEEIIGDILDVYIDKVLISSPLLVTARTNSSGKEATILTRYLPFTTNDVCEISLNHIITMTDIHEEMKRFYYHSLRVANEYEERMISNVKQANMDMESALMDAVAYTNGTSEGSNSLH